MGLLSGVHLGRAATPLRVCSICANLTRETVVLVTEDDAIEFERGRGPRHGDVFDVVIERIDPKGFGIGSVVVLIGPQQEPRRYSVKVRKTVPGDRVRVEVERYRKGVIGARVVSFAERSKMRIEPRCRHFGSRNETGKGCGGCTFQSLDQRHQLAVKERGLRRMFADAGLDVGLLQPVRGLDDPWFYRNKMEFSFGDDAERRYALGMHPSGYRYEVIRQDECFLMSRFVSDFVPRVRDWCEEAGLPPEDRDSGWLQTLTVREGKRTGERMVEVMTNHADEVSTGSGTEIASAVAARLGAAIEAIANDMGEPLTSIYWTQKRAVRGEPTRLIEHHLGGEKVLHEELELPGEHRLRFAIHPRAFFQPSTRGAELIYAEVIEQSGVSETEAGRVLDLYCGTGTIGLAMAPWADEVVGVELQPDAVENARKNAADNDITNVEFLCGDVGEILEERGLQGDVVVVDPPRAGLLPFAHEQLAQVEAERMVYVSCNPKALVRDLPILMTAGWTVERIQPIDQFPQTYHIENVIRLRR